MGAVKEKEKKKFTPIAEAGLEFNLEDITADEMTDFFEAARKNDNAGLAKVFAKTIVKCPVDWGEPADEMTYRNLPYFTHFKKVIEIFAQEANGKN
jgi:hypothetical protein